MRRALIWGLVFAATALGLWLLRATVFAPEPVPVEVHRVRRGTVEETVSNTRAGTVRVPRRATIGVDAPGRITAIEHREGERVERGDVLIRVDDREARAALERSQKERAAAEAEVESLSIRCDLLDRDADRLDSLHREGVVPEDRADSARTESRQCRADLATARERVSLARAAVKQARVALDRTVVRAPFSGIVNQVFAEVGEFGTPGSPVLDLMEPKDLFVRAQIDEVDLARVREGLPARISLDPFRGRHFQGKVTRVAPYVSEIEQQNRTLEVDVAFTDPGEISGVKPGTSADVEIILQKREGVLRVPSYALLKGDRLLVVEDGRAVERPVEVGLRNWDFAEILSGVEEGAPVIVSLDRAGVEAGARVVVEEKT